MLSKRPMVKNRFVVEVADTHGLKGAITRLRNIESVFDAYRVTPGGAVARKRARRGPEGACAVREAQCAGFGRGAHARPAQGRMRPAGHAVYGMTLQKRHPTAGLHLGELLGDDVERAGRIE